MEPDKKEAQSPSQASTPILVEAPPRPADKPCRAGCGKTLAPEFVPPVLTLGRIMSFSNRWQFPVDICSECAEAEAHALEIENAEANRIARERHAEARKQALAKAIGGLKAAEEFKMDLYVPKTPSQAEAIQACRSFSSERDNLYLWGPTTGTGKTHLACAVAAAYWEADKNVEFFKPGAFLRSLRVKEAKEQEERLNAYAAADVFVLDDIGLGSTTDFSLHMFYDLVDTRYMAKRNGLIVTSNLSLDDLATKMGDDRLASRLAGMCRVIKIEGPDARMEKRP